MHAGKRSRDGGPGALPGDGGAQKPAGPDRRHIKRFAPGHRREPGLTQQMRELRPRIGAAMAERRRVHARPQPAPVRHHREQAAAAGQHAPDLAQQTDRIGRVLKRMHEQHAVDRRVGERQVVFLDQCRERRLRRRPAHHALRRRHQRKAPFRLFTKQAQIGCGIADPEHALAGGVGPMRADAAADEPARHDAQPLSIEIAQIDNVHGRKLPRILPSFRGREQRGARNP